LVGINDNAGEISNSFATGAVKGVGNKKSGGILVGGLVEKNNGTIENSYATGNVSAGSPKNNGEVSVGGLVSINDGVIGSSYSTGAVKGGTGALLGGLIGDDEAPPGSLADTYWDTETSGITNLGQGAGNIANDPGITGLTTAQFQSGLPAGFDPAVWAENPKINDGFPYLLANPPAK
jgi:hypothetical protein